MSDNGKDRNDDEKWQKVNEIKIDISSIFTDLEISMNNSPIATQITEAVVQDSQKHMAENMDQDADDTIEDSSSSSHSSQRDDYFACSYCENNFFGRQLIHIGCGHVFCHQCIFQCYECNEMCPCCQEPITSARTLRF